MILLLFFMLLLYLILTLAIVLLNRRFPFDRLAGVEYERYSAREERDPKGWNWIVKLERWDRNR